MQIRFRFLTVGFALALVAVSVVVLWKSYGTISHKSATGQGQFEGNLRRASDGPAEQIGKSGKTAPNGPVIAGAATPANDIGQTLKRLLEVVRKEPGSSRQQWAACRNYLNSVPRESSSTAIREFLDSKQDAAMLPEFVIGSGGFLTHAPTVRVALLDYLGQIDQTGAARYAEAILASKGSPDEWAVGLRNYAIFASTPESRYYLLHKLREMISDASWQANPSQGFLEAFDVAVFLREPDLIELLSGLMLKKDNARVAHAAFLALDRLVLANPRGALNALLQNPDLMAGREATRASYFARANVTNGPERFLLESYLLSPHVTSEELAAFAGVYPNANFMLSNNLLTHSIPQTSPDLRTHDKEALSVVETWIRDERFTGVRSHLMQARKRLQSFVSR
jgi:hypothetical protein